jgi:hypothetical protein
MPLVKLDHYYPNQKQSKDSNYDITNFDVIAKGDETVGSIAAVLVDEQSQRIRYLVVKTGPWLLGKKVLLPIALGQIVYMDHQCYVHELTKEQIKSLPDYTDTITVDSAYEDQIRRVLRPLVAQATKTVDKSDTYALDEEPYFYAINDQQLKTVQEQLTDRKQQSSETDS